MKSIDNHKKLWAGLLACLLVCGWNQARAEQMLPASAVVQAVQGTAQVLDAQGLTRPLTAGTRLQAGDTVVTAVASTTDLLLPETGATIGLEAESRLKIEQLAYRDEGNRRLTKTLLDLQDGELLGNVGKLAIGSSFEVRMPSGVVSVRGTIFYVNALLGDVHVTSGKVNVTVAVHIGSATQSKTVEVGSGQSLFLPKLWDPQRSLNSLEAVRTPFLLQPKLLDWFANHTSIFEKYHFPDAEMADITATFKATRLGWGRVWILSPPEVDVVSYY
jgi:ferric-dicitrate binding protein FerR (iron transport regulator)